MDNPEILITWVHKTQDEDIQNKKHNTENYVRIINIMNKQYKL